MNAKLKSWSLRAWIVAVVFFALGSVAHAQFPMNYWDVHISGTTIGVGQILFFSDGTLAGFIIIRPNPNIHASSTLNVGGFNISGAWNYDPSGRVVGYFSGGSEAVPLDASFTAVGREASNPANSRLRMYVVSNNGPMEFFGKTFVEQFIGGTSWMAKVMKDGVRDFEFFQLTPLGFSFYDLVGGGPGYQLVGTVQLSWGNKIAFNVEELEIDKDTGVVATEGNIRTATGKTNKQKRFARMGAVDEDHTDVSMIVEDVSP